MAERQVVRLEERVAEDAAYRSSKAFLDGMAYWQAKFPTAPEPLFTRHRPFSTRATAGLRLS